MTTTVAAGVLTGTSAHAVAGEAVKDGTYYSFTAKLDIGEGKRSCSAALVDPRWVISARSCFADDPAQGSGVSAGKPKWKTTATIGRADLTGTDGQVSDVVELVPHGDRDLVMARLARPVTDIAPVSLATSAPTPGETLRMAGYGRTADEWVPDRLHAGAFTVGATDASTLKVSGTDGAAICKGDTGGPALRDVSGRLELVAVHSASWQAGCFGSDETRNEAVETRLDDVRQWVQETRERRNEVVTSADVTGDGKADLIVLDAEGNVSVRKNTGTSFAAATHWSAGWKNFLGRPGQGRLYFADVNGDGKADLIVHETSGNISVRTNKGTYFDSGTAWSKGWKNFLGQPGMGQLYFADINGDKKADLIVHETNGNISVRTNKGTYFDSGTAWSKGWKNFLGQPGMGQLYFADINGDKKADLIVHETNGNISVRTNKGTYFDSGTAWSKGWKNFLGQPGMGQLYFADINGDKKGDLVVHESNGNVSARLNKGTYFEIWKLMGWV